jgi:hypothetical protein
MFAYAKMKTAYVDTNEPSIMQYAGGHNEKKPYLRAIGDSLSDNSGSNELGEWR